MSQRRVNWCLPGALAAAAVGVGLLVAQAGAVSALLPTSGDMVLLNNTMMPTLY